MSAAPTTPAPIPASTGEPSRAGRLLGLVRKLIEYGRELAITLRRHSVATDLAAATRAFGTSDTALILARITRGLHRADALEARLVRGAARLDAGPRPQAPPAVAKSVSERRRAAPPAGSSLAPVPGLDPGMPTPEQIAADVRRRPIGVVIADICRDLGITPSHKLWRELQLAIIRHGGSLARLVSDLIDQMFQLPVPAAAPPAAPASFRPPPSPAGTGPP